MILRLWSGWATREGAAAYDEILNSEVAPAIVDRRIPGLSAFEVWTRRSDETDGEQEFLTAMRFESLEAVREFTGGDPHRSVVPANARAALSRFDAHSRHYDLRARHWPNSR